MSLSQLTFFMEFMNGACGRSVYLLKKCGARSSTVALVLCSISEENRVKE
jgi:hypothetical protein